MQLFNCLCNQPDSQPVCNPYNVFCFLQVILRSTTPQHFITVSGSGFYSQRIRMKEAKRCLKLVPHPISHPTNHFLLDMAQRYNFKYLDNLPIYFERGDLKVEQWSGYLDCTHHCYTPELVWPEVVLLTQLINKE